MEPVPDPLLLRKSGRDGNGTRTSGSVADKRRSLSRCSSFADSGYGLFLFNDVREQ
jgi:hypothetical protein